MPFEDCASLICSFEWGVSLLKSSLGSIDSAYGQWSLCVHASWFQPLPAAYGLISQGITVCLKEETCKTEFMTCKIYNNDRSEVENYIPTKSK